MAERERYYRRAPGNLEEPVHVPDVRESSFYWDTSPMLLPAKPDPERCDVPPHSDSPAFTSPNQEGTALKGNPWLLVAAGVAAGIIIKKVLE